jgi:hypothetical protein
VTRNPVFQFALWSLLLSHPVLAQDAIQIEIDSAPVEIELQKPAEPATAPEPGTPPQAETTPQEDDQKVAQESEEESKGIGKYGVAIGIGALIAGVLAALGGGGGGGGGGSSTPQHP